MIQITTPFARIYYWRVYIFIIIHDTRSVHTESAAGSSVAIVPHRSNPNKNKRPAKRAKCSISAETAAAVGQGFRNSADKPHYRWRCFFFFFFLAIGFKVAESRWILHITIRMMQVLRYIRVLVNFFGLTRIWRCTSRSTKTMKCDLFLVFSLIM